jgi:hypothetical protein
MKYKPVAHVMTDSMLKRDYVKKADLRKIVEKWEVTGDVDGLDDDAYAILEELKELLNREGG